MALAQEIRPAYEVHPFSGKTIKKVYSFNEKTRALESKEVESNGGYMVYFPKGHSIRLADDASLKAHGFDRPASMVDLETGDEVAEGGILKRRTRQMTRATKSGENLEGDNE